MENNRLENLNNITSAILSIVKLMENDADLFSVEDVDNLKNFSLSIKEKVDKELNERV